MFPLQSINIINGLLSVTYARNSGAAFSILQSQRVLFIIIAIGVFIIVWYNRFQIKRYSQVFQLGVAVALGGTFGNFIDRVRFGYVVDFIHLHFWPIFNIADIAIVCGVGFIVLGLLTSDSLKGEKTHARTDVRAQQTIDGALIPQVAVEAKEHNNHDTL